MDQSKSMGNGPFVGSTPASSKPYLANGVCKEKPIGFPSNDTSFPSGGSPSLHLPLVVVLNLICLFSESIWFYCFSTEKYCV